MCGSSVLLEGVLQVSPYSCWKCSCRFGTSGDIVGLGFFFLFFSFFFEVSVFIR